MEHHFTVEIAERYGMLEAVLLNNLYYWIMKNEANDKNYHDGYYWTYNSAKAFHELFPYASDHRIRNALKHLEEEGLIVTGNYNQSAYDRTMWYALTKTAKCILQNYKMEVVKTQNGSCKNTKPIPNNNTDNKTNKKNMPPTLEDVKEYCRSRSNGIDAEAFIDYYQQQGWKLANGNKMKDWQAAIRTWEKREKKKEPKRPEIKPYIPPSRENAVSMPAEVREKVDKLIQNMET